MVNRLETIIDGVSCVDGINCHKPLELSSDGVIRGGITVTVPSTSLKFDIVIYPPYPLQFHEAETIRFYNNDLIEYNHVNKDGSICIHTPHNSDLKSKIYYDLQSLKVWVNKYYKNESTDPHYEHIVIPQNSENPYSSSFLFTSVEHQFQIGDFGIANIALLSKGIYNKKETKTFIVHGFHCARRYVPCKWSAQYSTLPYFNGLYAFIGDPPVHKRNLLLRVGLKLKSFFHKIFSNLFKALLNEEDLERKRFMNYRFL